MTTANELKRPHDLRDADHDLIVALRRTSQDLIDKRSIRDRDTLLSQLVVSAVSMIPTATGGGISRTEDRDVRSSHATTQMVYELDQLQSRLDEGPCIEAADHPPDDGILLARDLAGDDATRWPRFAPYAVEAGIHSILSVSLIGMSGGRRSALNLYATERDAFDGNALMTASLFAGHAAALLYGADNAHYLGVALSSRDTIGQAKGILMERFTLDGAEAFEMLVKSSQETNMKLVNVAEWLVHEADQRRSAR